MPGHSQRKTAGRMLGLLEECWVYWNNVGFTGNGFTGKMLGILEMLGVLEMLGLLE